MKKINYILSALILIAMTASYSGSLGKSSNTFDEKTSTVELLNMNFKEVKIGNQIWMASNFYVDKFSNGDPIPQAKSAEEWKQAIDNREPAWCYYDNDPDHGDRYGKLYNWYTVNDPRGLAPSDWHVPNDEEWTVLCEFLGGMQEAGTKLKSSSGWKESNFNYSGGTNSSGFNALPGENRGPRAIFAGIGDTGYWWSSTEYNRSTSWIYLISYGHGLITRTNRIGKNTGISVRCVRD